MSRWRRYLAGREGRLALLCVVGCGIALGYFICRTFVMPLTKTYPPDFGKAQWIQVADKGDAGYFRKDLYIESDIESAWLMIAATGSYQLVVNNVQLDNYEFPGARPSNIYDITALLAPGQNVVAVYVAGDSSIGRRQIIVRGSIKVAGAPAREFVTDTTWRATPAASSIPGGALWSAPAYDDSSWRFAAAAGTPADISMLLPLSVDPRLLTAWAHGKWITGPNNVRGAMIFTNRFHAAERPRAGWLELAANGAYSVTVNGQLAQTVPTTVEAELFGPNAPVILTGTATRYSKLPVLITPRGGLPGSHIYSAIEQSQLTQFKNSAESTNTNVSLVGASVSAIISSNAKYNGNESGSQASPSQSTDQIGATIDPNTGEPTSSLGSSSLTSSTATTFSTSTNSIASGNSVTSLGGTLPYGGGGGMGGGGSLGGPTGYAGNASYASAGQPQPSMQAVVPSGPASTGGATGGAASTNGQGHNGGQGSQSNYKYAGSLGATKSLSPAQIMAIPDNPDTTPNAPPSTGDISPPPAPTAAQVFPLTMTPGDAPQTALALTAYDISPYLRAGENTIVIRLHAGLGAPALMADGLAEFPDGHLWRIATGPGWNVRLPNLDGSAREIPASIAGDFVAAPWGPPVWVAANGILVPGQDTWIARNWTLTILPVTAALVLLWYFVGLLFAKPDVGPEPVWSFDALLHVPIGLAVLAMFLSTFDVRLPYDWCFTPVIAWSLIVLFLLSKLLLFAARQPAPLRLSTATTEPRRFEWQWIALFAIVVIGFLLRFDRFNKTWMVHDETAMVVASWAIPKYGFPLVHAGSYTRYLATYELVPYPIAFFTAFLGRCITAYRLPSLIFSTLTIGLVGYIGRRMFDWRVGLLAALLWALLPIPINWAKDAFYPSQEGFFSALTFWCFWETIKGRGINAKFMRLTSLFFILQYFSWEASGFVVITLFVAILVIKWGQWDEWVLDPTLWRCFAVVSTVVICQLCYRQISGAADYLGVMKDLSDICTPAIVPLDRLVFNPLYYLGILFFAENHILITIVAILAIPLAFRNRALLYIDVCLIALYICYTFFLDHYAPRYCFIWLSSLVLASAASFIALCDLFAEIRLPRWNTALKAFSMTMAMVILVLASNQKVMRLYRLAPDPEIPVWYDRVNVPYKTNYHDPNMYVLNHMLPGDIVVSMNPHMFFFDSGGTIRPDYCLNSLLALRMFYDGGIKPITLIDKWLGSPQLRNLGEMQDVTARAGRVWIIGTSLHDHSPAVSNFISRNGRLVFESVKEQVWLINSVPTQPHTTFQGSASSADLSPAKPG